MSERVHRVREGNAERKGSRQSAPAQITLLYESRDGRLCLFEDARGHLFAVPSSLLA